MTTIALKKVSKAFGSVSVLSGLDLEIRSGEFLVLLGPSGCGKSTTMRIIAGLEPATSGDVLVDGVRINDLPARERDMAMVFQNYGLYPHMSVAQNIAYPLRLRGISADEQKVSVAEVAQKVQLGDFLNRKPKALSGGQRQRVALARAIIRNPNVFLLDEPLSNLDAKLRVSMRTELHRMHHENGVTTVYVTHDQIEAMTLADRVAVMNEGRIVQLGSPQEIFRDPQDLFVASFVGTPEINRIDGSISNGVFSAPSLRIEGINIADMANVTLGVRPVAVNVAKGEHPDATATGTIYSAEYGGDTTYVTALLGETHVTALAEPDEDFSFDQMVSLNIRPSECMFFDTSTGARIRPRRADVT